MIRKLTIAEGEGIADIRICSLERYHQDDLEGEFSKCHHPVFYRPQPPYLIPFVCLKCAGPDLLNEFQSVMSPTTVRELIDYFREQRKTPK